MTNTGVQNLPTHPVLVLVIASSFVLTIHSLILFTSMMTPGVALVAVDAERHVLKGHSGSIDSLAWSPDEKLLASGSWDGTVRLWDIASELEQQVLSDQDKHKHILSVSWSPDGKLLAFGGWGKTVTVWDVNKKKVSQVLTEADVVLAVAWSPDGKTLATVSPSSPAGGVLQLWDLPSGKRRFSVEGHKIGNVAWSPSGSTIACACAGNSVGLIDAMTGKVGRLMEGHTQQVWTLAWSNDGKVVASGSFDTTVRLWDAATGREKAVLKGHTRRVTSVSVSAKAELLASASFDNTILWDRRRASSVARSVGIPVSSRLRFRRAENAWLLAALTARYGCGKPTPF